MVSLAGLAGARGAAHHVRRLLATLERGVRAQVTKLEGGAPQSDANAMRDEAFDLAVAVASGEPADGAV